jgi:hypothetical protein
VRELVGLEEDAPLIVIFEGFAQGFTAPDTVDDGDPPCSAFERSGARPRSDHAKSAAALLMASLFPDPLGASRIAYKRGSVPRPFSSRRCFATRAPKCVRNAK